MALAAAALCAPAAGLHAQVAASVVVNVRGVAVAPAGSAEEPPAQPGRPASMREDPAPSLAVAGATVVVRGTGLAATTDARGAAVLRGVPPGRQSLLISALGFAEAVVEVEAVNGRVARAAALLAPAPVRIAGLQVRAEREGGAGATVIQTASLPAGVTDLAAALDRVPGATVVRRGGPGAPAVVQLRGAGGDQVLVLFDGVSINSPLTGEADLSTVDLEAVSRIVVVPGAQSARYGPQALGGVVLLEGRDPAAGAASGVATGGVGAWSASEVALSGARAFADVWSVSGGARWRRSGGAFAYDVPDFRGGGEAKRDNAAFSQAGADLRVTRRGAADLSLHVHLADIDRGSPGTIAQPSLTGRQHHLRHGVSARLEPARAAASALGGSARASVQWQRAEHADPDPPFGSPYDTRTRVRRADVDLEGWWRRAPAAMSRPASRPAAPVVRFGLHAARLDVESTVLTAAALDLDELGAWARVEHGLRPAPGVRLDVGAAVRVDRHDLVDGAVFSPAADAALARGGTTIDVRWGRGFSPPGLGDLFFQEGVLVEPNPDLAPERVRSEVSVHLSQRWSLRGSAGEVRAGVYRADLDDMILWFPDHRFVWSPDNHDVARRGLELGASAELPALGRTHVLAAGAAWSEVEYTGAVLGGQVAYRPRFTADASLALELPGGVVLTPSAAHVGERRTVPGSPLNALAGYTLLDAGASIPFELAGRAGRLDLALANLLDKRAALLVDYPLPGRGWSVRARLET